MSSSQKEPLPGSLVQLLDKAAQLNALQRQRGYEFTPIGMRENLDAMTRGFVTQAPEMPLVRDTMLGRHEQLPYPVPVRIYHPSPDTPLPVLVFSHGGGHMAGSVSTYDRIARKLAHASRHLVVSVDYRLAPECPYPQGLTDLKNVIFNLFDTLERLGVQHLRHLALAGDSGGGAITASAVHELADTKGIEIARQLLIYPSLDYTMASASMDSMGKGYLLEKDRIGWLFEQYFQHGEDRKKASPLFMPLPRRYPRTLIATAAYCPLRDEGFAYIDRLRADGVEVVNLHFPNMIHAFLNLEDLVPDECTAFYGAAGDFLQSRG